MRLKGCFLWVLFGYFLLGSEIVAQEKNQLPISKQEVFGEDVDSLKPQLDIGGYLEVYYNYDFNDPEDGRLQPFFFNHNRHNNLSLNMGVIEFGYGTDWYHAELDLQVGTYAQDNYANEEPVMRHIYQGYVGLALTRNRKFWLDAGIFESHLGTESAKGALDLTLTRSLSAESMPYYLAGVRAFFRPNEKWEFMINRVNGWQQIQRPPNNTAEHWGTNIAYSSKKLDAHWGTFLSTTANNGHDSTLKRGYYTNLDFRFKLGRWDILLSHNHGFAQKAKDSESYDQVFSMGGILGYRISKKWKTAARIETMDDPSNILGTTATGGPFVLQAYSANIDFRPYDPILVRLEGKFMEAPNDIFIKDQEMVNTNFLIATSLSATF